MKNLTYETKAQLPASRISRAGGGVVVVFVVPFVIACCCC